MSFRCEHCHYTNNEIELEIPPMSQKGEVTTVEGVLQRTVAGLEQDQPVRRIMDPDNADKIDTFVGRIRDLCLSLSQEFTVVIDDHSGNSFIENPLAPAADPATKVTYYQRTKEQDHDLCLYTEDEVHNKKDTVLQRTKENYK